MTTETQRMAVIGLGSMGAGIATSLLRAGHDVTGVDPSAAARQSFADQGGKTADSPASAATDAEVVISVVINAQQTDAVLFGDAGALETMPADSLFISCATVPPAFARDSAARLAETGRHYLDAPMSGGPAKASEGALTVMASGTPDAFARAEAALDGMAQTVYRLGDAAGPGSAVKMINQLLAGVHIAAACEAMTFGIKNGLEPKQLYEVICNAAGGSWMFENRVPHILEGDYSPKSAVEIFTKDLGIVLDTARAEQFPVPIAGAALQMFMMTAAAGMAKDDDASVARLYARIAGLELPGATRP